MERHYAVEADPDGQSADHSERKTQCDDIEISRCFVTFSSEQNALSNQLEDEFINDWSAELEYRPQDGSDLVALANARFWFIHLDRLGEDDVFSAMDAHSNELSDLLSVMNSNADERYKVSEDDIKNHLRVRLKHFVGKCRALHPEKEVTEEMMFEAIWPHWKLRDEMNERGTGNLVFLDRIEVVKRFGGRLFGRCLAQKIIDNFGRGFDAVVAIPFPLQWESRRGAPSVEGKENAENKKLFDKDLAKVVAVWESMWFFQFGGPLSRYWGRCESWAHPIMVIEENTIKFVDPQ